MLTKKTMMLADSKEVRITHYRARIKILTEKLGKLNLLEHPCEIRSICSEIITIKSSLRADGISHFLHADK